LRRFAPVAHLVDMSGIASSAVVERPDVERAAAGDAAAFTRIVRHYHADMTRLAYVVTGDPDLANDAVQLAWESAWSKLRSIRDPARIRPWLLSIAANEARQACRRRRRHKVVEIQPTVPGLSRHDPAEGIARIDLVRALQGLDPTDRALLALRYVCGFDAGELGALTGLSASATRTRLSRLTARLRRELGDD
jgi:RNA polymerase sigma factor (sigma-70 family)